MDVVMTGAVGFLGSHLLLEWSMRHPESKALCVVRSSKGVPAAERVHRALEVAAHDCGVVLSDVERRDALRRISVVEADMATVDLPGHPQFHAWSTSLADGSFEVLHGAANLSFRQEDRGTVWATNVDGTARFLSAMIATGRCRAFNTISTAYVAGSSSGTRFEDDPSTPATFHNPYEESKWHAERTAWQLVEGTSTALRVLRPSIIVGHSRTHRVSTTTGFYKVVDVLRQLAPMVAAEGGAPIIVPSAPMARLDLVPVDIVAHELFDILDAGEASTGRTYHLTNARPMSFADVCLAVADLTGVVLSPMADGPVPRPMTSVEALARRGMRHYLPYFRQERTHDRSNVIAVGAGMHQDRYWLDVPELRAMATSFLGADLRGGVPLSSRVLNLEVEALGVGA